MWAYVSSAGFQEIHECLFTCLLLKLEPVNAFMIQGIALSLDLREREFLVTRSMQACTRTQLLASQRK